ncbi:uncharacterized protein C8Q71DRAFT_722098 [Rhodofomes roseus]|uniref:Uncharacterized protein n=1 Tax=Rhodofomes roseus TaxID=34475 RepID=A0ABQ8KLW9_9APHY|nr:uncharacterized protein C8Q71DRAFT_722098 [Rhodofomes roseus]KAH9839065.1 hypothetical protein C8Q71DRAFT_722098 [Rhodofomes roseus]
MHGQQNAQPSETVQVITNGQPGNNGEAGDGTADSQAGQGASEKEGEWITAMSKAARKKKKAADKRKKLADLGRGTPPTQGEEGQLKTLSTTLMITPTATSETDRQVSGKRKRRRATTEDLADDGGEGSLPQPVTRVQEAPGALHINAIPPPRQPEIAVNEHNHGQRSESQRNLDAMHAAIAEANRPSFCHPSSEWDTTKPGEEWNQHSFREFRFWQPSSRNTQQSQGGKLIDPYMSDESFDAPSIDDLIRSVKPLPAIPTTKEPNRDATPSPTPRRRAARMTTGSRQGVPKTPNKAKEAATPMKWLTKESGRTSRAPEEFLNGLQGRLGMANPQKSLTPQITTRILDTKTQPGTAIPRRSRRDEPKVEVTNITKESERQTNSRASSVLSYVTNHPSREQQPREDDDDAMSIDDEGDELNAPHVNQANLLYNLSSQRFQRPTSAASGSYASSEEQEDEDDEDFGQLPHDVSWEEEDFTPKPPGNWRRIQGNTHLDKYAGQRPQQANQWMANEGHCLLVQYAEHGALDKDPEHWLRFLLLEDLLKVRYGVPEPDILAPQPLDNAEPGINVAPYNFLVRNLTRAQKERMIRDGWASTKYLTVYFNVVEPVAPEYMGTFGRPEAFLTTKASIARAIFCNGFQKNPLYSATINIIRRDKKSGPTGKWGNTPTRDAFKRILDSIHVHVMRRKLPGSTNKKASSPLYVLYCESPTTNAEDWATFKETVRNQPFNRDGGCTATLCEELFLCKLCHSADHNIGMCDLPKTPGWNGPHSEKEEEERRQAQAQRGTSSRGRSNSRGGMITAGRGRGYGYGQSQQDFQRGRGRGQSNNARGWHSGSR